MKTKAKGTIRKPKSPRPPRHVDSIFTLPLHVALLVLRTLTKLVGDRCRLEIVRDRDGRAAIAIYVSTPDGSNLFDCEHELVLLFTRVGMHIAFLFDDDDAESLEELPPRVCVGYPDSNFIGVLVSSLLSFLPSWPPAEDVLEKLRLDMACASQMYTA